MVIERFYILLLPFFILILGTSFDAKSSPKRL